MYSTKIVSSKTRSASGHRDKTILLSRR